jgi:ABC-type transport system involved in multi-copper enzyme maturation permease subunit
MLSLLPPLAVVNWVTVWFTPIWVLAVGLSLGLVLTLLLVGLMAVLSRIPFLGNLASRRPQADLVAGVIAVLFTVGAASFFLPRSTDPDRLFLILPLLAVGALLGWGFVFGVWRRTARDLQNIFQEGVFLYLLVPIALTAVIGLCVSFFVESPRLILESVPLSLRSSERVWEIPLAPAPSDQSPDAAPFVEVELDYEPERVTAVNVVTDRTVLVADAADPGQFLEPPKRLEPDEPVRWKRGDQGQPPLPLTSKRGVFMQNREVFPAQLTITIESKPPVPEALAIPVVAGMVVALLLTYITLRQAAPRVSAVALATAKNEIAQPLFLLLVVVGCLAIMALVLVPFNTLGEDIKPYKDTCMTLIMVFGILQAVWSAGSSVAEEIEGRTALTVLSKPISRRSFLIGKYLGICWTVVVLFLILGLLLLVMTAYKPIFEARETSTETPQWTTAFLEVATTVPPLVLLLMQTLLLAAIAVAIATRLPLLANLVICFTIYVVGNLTAPIVRSAAGQNELVRFFGRLMTVLIPNLDSFNVQAAVDSGSPIPVLYLAAAFTYWACFALAILLVALLLFEDRDLA